MLNSNVLQMKFKCITRPIALCVNVCYFPTFWFWFRVFVCNFTASKIKAIFNSKIVTTMNFSNTPLTYPEQEKLRLFLSFEKVRQSGLYNMIMDAGSAAIAAGLTSWEYKYVIKHYDELSKFHQCLK